MSDGPDLFGRIQALLIEGNLDPTPAHYEFLYRYVTGSDPQIVEAVNAVRRMTGTIDARVVGNIRRELYGVGRGGVGRVLDDAEAQLSRISSMSSVPAPMRAITARGSAAASNSVPPPWNASVRCSPR